MTLIKCTFPTHKHRQLVLHLVSGSQEFNDTIGVEIKTIVHKKPHPSDQYLNQHLHYLRSVVRSFLHKAHPISENENRQREVQ